MRRFWVTFLLAAAVVGCGSSTSTSETPANNGGATQAPGGHGNATATVVIDGKTYDLSGGTCTDIGAVLGTQVAVGDYANGEAGTGDYLVMFVKGDTVSTVGGRAGGIPWTLATGKQSGSIGADMKGTFSGTNSVSGKQVSGTFACN
jgi:hypothetical protein